MHDTAVSQRTPIVPLAGMMFLQFFLWGAWYVTLGPFMAAMKFSEGSIGNAYSVGPIAAIISPVFLGMIADRFFASQRVLGIMHLLGGVALLAAPSVAAQSSGDAWPFVGLLLVHMLCYMPTLGLSNTVAFHHVKNQEKEFPLIRVLGTIGWIAAGFVVGYLMRQAAGANATEAQIAAQPVFFYAAGGCGIILGLFSFMLPHTPPPAAGRPFSLRDALGLDAISMLKSPSFAVFIICSFLICIPLAAYYSTAGRYVGATGFKDVATTMTFGQMSEIFFMLVMPLCFARLGVKWMLAVGMLAWVVRYGLFAAAWGGDGPGTHHVEWMVLGGIILHGICYDFFFVTGQIYVDKQAPKQVRGQAQGFLVLVTQGVGMLIGAQVISRVVAANTKLNDAGAEIGKNWQTIWLIPCIFAGAILLIFLAAFRNGPKTTASN